MHRFAAVLIALLAAAPASAQTYQLVRQWSVPVNSRAIAVGPDGSVYVAGGEAISRFSGEGAPLGQFNPGGPTRSVAVDAAGFVYTVVGDEVRKFDSGGAPMGAWTSDWGPNDRCVALDESGRVYVFTDDSVLRIDPADGSELLFWDGNCTTSAARPAPRTMHSQMQDIAVSLGRTYVTESWGTMHAFNESGCEISPWGGLDGVSDQYGGLCVDDGFVFVCDYALGGRVQKVTSEGAFVEAIPVDSPPADVAVHAGEVFVLAGAPDVVLVYAPTAATPVARATWGQVRGRWAR